MFVYNFFKELFLSKTLHGGGGIMEEKFFQNNDIWAFTPEYSKDIGETTRVLFSHGRDRLLPINIRTFKINLCSYYSIDYKKGRAKYGKIIGSVNCVPIPITDSKIFLHLKVRVPEVKGDRAMGYVDLNCIKNYKTGNDRKGVELELKDGRVIQILYSISTINKHMKNARIILEYYKRERGYTEYPLNLERLYSGFDKPATKADIAILAREIATLKNSLKVF